MQDFSKSEVQQGQQAVVLGIQEVPQQGFSSVPAESALTIYAHISISMSRQIQQRVREATDKPIHYVVNSNYHGDHTFGNCAFPAETRVIQQREPLI